MRIFILVISFLFLSFSQTFANEITSPPNHLKILSMNFNAEADNPLLFQKRLAIFERTIQEKNLDLVLVQEGWQIGKLPCFAIQVAKDLNMDLVYRFEDGVSGYRVTSIVILAKKELHLRNVNAFKLPHSAVTFGDDQTTWVGLGQVNMLIGGQITLSNGQDAFIWTTHLYTDNSDYRVDQVKFIHQKMQEAVQSAGQEWNKSWIFLTGDLNSLPDSPEMDYLRENAGLQDAWNLSHPNDPGYTFVADITSPEYNPITHNPGLFPLQYAPDHTARIDYIYAHIPSAYSVGATRTFTAPIENVWMTDHYGLTANFVFASDIIQEVPSADSDIDSAGFTTAFAVNDADIDKLPQQKDFIVDSIKGLTMVNNTHYKMRFYFSDDNGAAYNTNQALLSSYQDTVSFTFFNGGNFHYRLIITDLQNRSVAQMYGVAHVADLATN